MNELIEITDKDEVLFFFKALANVERLKIVGLVAIKACSIPELAEALHLKPAQVARHLAYLAEMSLVKETGKGFELNAEAIQSLSRHVLANARPRVTPEDFEGEDFDRKVLSDFMTPEGRLKAIPMQQKKLMVILRYLAQLFKPEARYPEKEVNEILRRFHPDTASLRRSLVDNGLLLRQAGVYWRA